MLFLVCLFISLGICFLFCFVLFLQLVEGLIFILRNINIALAERAGASPGASRRSDGSRIGDTVIADGNGSVT